MRFVKNLIASFLIFLSCYSCMYNIDMGGWEIRELYALKIDGTSKVMYKYDAWGGFDSHAAGYILLDSTEAFKVNPKNDLPFHLFAELPCKDKIIGVSYKCVGTCGENYKKSVPIYKPIEIQKTEIGEILIENFIYQYRGYSERSSGLERYHFENFKETRDSLFFYNLDDLESVNGKHLDSLKLKKKMVYIHEKAQGEIIKLVVDDVLLVIEEIKSNKTYFLKPKNITSSNAFTDVGIFKSVKLNNDY